MSEHVNPIPAAADAATGAAAEVAPGVTAPSGAIRFQFARSGGPGGQNVNKLNTKAELWVKVHALLGMRPSAIARLKDAAGRRLTAGGEIHLVSETERGQAANRAEVLRRLREMIVAAKVEPKVRRKTKITRAQKAKRLEQKKRRGSIKAMRRPSFDE